ncbi:MAG TPA: flippase-like domain-containing protein [Solirubrobacteraceae bacterium]|nr:flippase-like domain-containing protein [Solirubrobacteraceae bacterium]
MRVAILSPYSWTYPGGVTRHIEALAERFIDDGHHVRVLAPFDLTDRFGSVLHRGARPQPMEKPDYLVSLGRTFSLNANQAVSNISITPHAYATAVQELRTGGYDVVHVHEPLAPVSPWLVTDRIGLPLVGTFHTYNENRISNGMANVLGARRMLNRLHVRIAVSEAAAWTARRFFGGHYRIIPNGVHVDAEKAALGALRPQSDKLRIVFVGQAVERKGLPLLLRAFEALREHIPTELTVIGPSAQELSPLMLDMRDVRVLGKVDDDTKRAELEASDVLCAPSLGGESFGMVLTEAFAAGTPVVASDIAGYRDVVRDGVDGVLAPRGDAQALAEALRDLYEEPARRAGMARAAALGAERFAWTRVAAQVMEAYEDAIAVPEPATRLQRAAVRVGARAADLKPHVPPQRLASLEPPLTVAQRHSKALGIARRVGLATVSIGGAVLAFLALQKIGLTNIASALITAKPTLVLLGLAIMCGSMVLRAVSWHAILRAALPRSRVRMSDAAQGTFIGVLMSSTLPARLGEPSRALVVARRTGRPRENLPIVLGTVVSQTLLNIVALVVLGAIMFSSVDLFSGHQNALLVAALAPVALLTLVLIMPVVLRGTGNRSRTSRVHALAAQVRGALARVRAGLIVFRRPRLGATATAAQLSAWALQCLSCWVLLVALGLDKHGAGIGAAAAVLFAVNITAVLPATPANLGVFQAACAAVLHTGWHVGYGDGVAFGVILQAVEVTTAIVMGMPALLKEGMSWREVRLRAMHTTPVKLPARPSSPIAGRPASQSVAGTRT